MESGEHIWVTRVMEVQPRMARIDTNREHSRRLDSLSEKFVFIRVIRGSYLPLQVDGGRVCFS
jgi:hypothetical protein